MRDLDVRRVLHKSLRTAHEEPDTLVLDEFGLCQGAARIDVAVVNGELQGYEIKSAKDTLQRLPVQAQCYSQVLDRVTLVVADNHLEALEIIPEWWGVKVASQGKRGAVHFKSLRRALKNPSIDSYALSQLLWKDECLAILDGIGKARGLKSKPRKIIWQALSESLPLNELRDTVRQTLKNRTEWRSG